MEDQNKALEEQRKRVIGFSEKILEFLETECKTQGYRDIDLYLSVKYLLARIEGLLGRERINKINSSFKIVQQDEYKKC